MQPDFNSQTWQWLEDELKKEREKIRAQLEGVSSDNLQMLQGQIQMIKQVMNWKKRG